MTSTTEDVDITLLRKAGIRLPTNAASCSRRALTSTTQLQKPQISKLLTFKRRIKSHLPSAGIIRSSPYSPRFQDKD